MPEPELFLLFVRPLNRAGIRYVVSASVAAIFYGEHEHSLPPPFCQISMWFPRNFA